MIVYEAIFDPLTPDYDSGYVTLSIHKTKSGARRAIAKHKKEWLIQEGYDPSEPISSADWDIRETKVLNG